MAIGNQSLLLITALAAASFACGTSAQTPDLARPQVHGFATQSVLYSNQNNYLGMNTTAGSPDWTEAAVNVTERFTGKLRAGTQAHITKLGAFGSYAPTIDWALLDYSARSYLGVRAGKVKIKWGLFNDTQDADVGYLWALLPESVYGVDIRATNLSQYGVETYGRVPLGERFGNLEYSAYYGDYSFASNDGYAAIFKTQGLDFVSPAHGKTPGIDLRYSTPRNALMVGGSIMFYDARGRLTNGSFSIPLTFWPTYFAQYQRRRVSASAQYVKLVQYQVASTSGMPPSTSGSDTRAWFVMGSYRLSHGFQAGAYYTRYLVANGADHADPANYIHDTVLSGRYDFAQHVYAKVEGHFVSGNALGFYSLDNPGTLQPRSNVLVSKVGFSF